MDPQQSVQHQIPTMADSLCGKLGCALFDHLPLAVVAIGRQGCLIAVNPEACRMFGLSAEHLIGRHIPGLDAETGPPCMVCSSTLSIRATLCPGVRST